LRFEVSRDARGEGGAKHKGRANIGKQGMRIIDRLERDYVCGRLSAEIWEITVEEWRAKKARTRKAGEPFEKD
jgi:hypothetical protein